MLYFQGFEYHCRLHRQIQRPFSTLRQVTVKEKDPGHVPYSAIYSGKVLKDDSNCKSTLRNPTDDN